MSLRDSILAQKPKRETVTPSFLDGQPVGVRVMSLGARGELLKGFKGGSEDVDEAKMIARLVIETACDPTTGQPMFALPDLDSLLELPSNVLDELALPAMRLNGLMVSSLEVALKNSNATPSSSPNSDSPNVSE